MYIWLNKYTYVGIEFDQFDRYARDALGLNKAASVM